MTSVLQQALSKLSKLPENQQEAIAYLNPSRNRRREKMERKFC